MVHLRLTGHNCKCRAEKQEAAWQTPCSSGFDVLTICFVVSVWIWCWDFWLSVIHKDLWHKECGGQWIHTDFILLRGYSRGCDETAHNLLPADSTLQFPRVLQEPVGFWNPVEQLWWLLSSHLIDSATFKVSPGTRWCSGERREIPEVCTEIIQLHVCMNECLLCLSSFWICLPGLNPLCRLAVPSGAFTFRWPSGCK